MKMSNETYDVLVYVAQIVLPALSVLYAALAAVWGLPYEQEIPVSIMAVDTFLGTLLKLSNDNYKKGINNG